MNKIKESLVLILGMHRSGTSCLTGILKELGLFTGILANNPLAMNDRGSHEAREVFILNEKLLKLNNGSWFRPITVQNIPAEITNQANYFKAILRSENFSKQKILIKDPRMLFCHELWEEPDTYFIGSFRHPSKVVQSLQVRNKKNDQEELNKIDWLEVWYQYNLRLIEKHRRLPFPIVCFDWEESTYIQEISYIAKEYLSLEVDNKNISFFSKDLKRNENTTIIPQKYIDLYIELQNISTKNSESITMSKKHIAKTTGLGIGLGAGQEHYRAYVGPPEDYDLVSAMVFNLVTSIGLRQYHKLIDIGCGSLRNGRLFIPYLNIGNYIGIEPNEWLVSDGIENELGQSIIDIKKPTFSYKASLEDFNDENLSADFAVAQSIFSHTGKQMTLDWLKQIHTHLNTTGILLATFLHAKEDTQAEGWIYPGCVRFKPDTIAAMGVECGFKVKFLKWAHPRQIWVAFYKKDYDNSLIEDGTVTWNKFVQKHRMYKFKKNL